MKIIDNRQPIYIRFDNLKPGDLFKLKCGQSVYLKTLETIADYTQDELDDVNDGSESIYAFIQDNRTNAICLSDITPSFMWFDNDEQVAPINAELHIK